MKKVYIAAFAAAILVTGGLAADASFVGSCNYETDGTFKSNGKVSAYGTMADARYCASQGILPDVVAERLGVWGDAETQELAQEINLLNESVRLKNEKAEQDAASVES